MLTQEGSYLGGEVADVVTEVERRGFRRRVIKQGQGLHEPPAPDGVPNPRRMHAAWGAALCSLCVDWL